MSFKPQMEAERELFTPELDVLSRLGNGVKVRSLRALVQTNRPRLWAKVGTPEQPSHAHGEK
jgi:hypothetical protein